MMEQINIGLCGFGVVGSGVYKILKENKSEITKKTGTKIEIKKILVKNQTKKRNLKVPSSLFTTDYKELINNKEIDIIIELIGGTTLAKKIILEAIKNKKSVVTANKALLALEGQKIIQNAEKKSVDVFFEASVAGGIPIIKVFKESLAANKIDYFYGILNGTANYILTKMTEENIDFSKALKEAQKKGYAESDPTLDIEGIDAAHKLSILIALAYNINFNFKEIYVEGISNITPQDIKLADEFGYTIKLLGISKKENNKIEGRVHPVMIKKDSILSSIKGVFNAIYVKGNFLGPALFYGKGAGSLPTASAVVSDLIEAAINLKNECRTKKPLYSVYLKDFKKNKIKNIDEIKTKYYLRFSAIDKPGVLSKISGILGENNISIEAVIQKGRVLNKNKQNYSVPIVMTTHEAVEKNIKRAIEKIDKLDIVKDKTTFIRIESFDE